MEVSSFAPRDNKTMDNHFETAPELVVSTWFNTEAPLELSQLRGKVVALHTFQMLCPGCVSHGLPQASKIYELYQHEDVQVIGLHTVFEHHAVMNKEALQAFIHEYKLQFPIAIDEADSDSDIPVTMQRYKLRGTPSLVLIDKNGNIRLNYFGRLGDMQVGNALGQLLTETGSELNTTKNGVEKEPGLCDENGCVI